MTTTHPLSIFLHFTRPLDAYNYNHTVSVPAGQSAADKYTQIASHQESTGLISVVPEYQLVLYCCG